MSSTVSLLSGLISRGGAHTIAMTTQHNKQLFTAQQQHVLCADKTDYMPQHSCWAKNMHKQINARKQNDPPVCIYMCIQLKKSSQVHHMLANTV